jgi:hypothetical protein
MNKKYPTFFSHGLINFRECPTREHIRGSQKSALCYIQGVFVQSLAVGIKIN